MQKINQLVDVMPGRVRSVERDFIQYICDEVGLSKKEVQCLSEFNKINGCLRVSVIVNNSGVQAESDVSFDPRSVGANDAAKQSMADDIFERLSSKALDLRSTYH